MATKKKKISDLVQDSRNANLGTDIGGEALSTSLAKYKAGRSVLLDKEGRIIAGNKTAQKWQELGHENVVVVETDGNTLVAVQRTDIELDSAEGRGLAVADNRVGELNLQWSEAELKALSDDGFLNLDDFWDKDELGEMFEDDSPSEDEEGLEEILNDLENEDKELRVHEEEIWQLGNHFIACADSTDEASIRLLMDKAGVDEIDMVWADPPYGISIVATNEPVGGGEAYDIPFGGVKNKKGYVGGGNCSSPAIAECQAKKGKRLGTIGGSKPFGSKNVRGSDSASNVVKANKYFPIEGDESIDVAYNATKVYLELFPEGLHCWWGGNYYSSKLPDSNCWIVWDKENTGNFADAELAWTNSPTAVRIFKHMWNGMVKASEHGQRRVHPTQKPVALAKWFYDNYGKDGDTIIDPFLGSGMSLIAAEETSRKCIGFELSPHYCTVIVERWEKLTGKTAEKVGNI